MSSEQLEASPQPTSATGSLAKQVDNVSKDSLISNTSSVSQTNSESMKIDGNTEEQALESHEVIELQTFSERKAWIEEKIKFLEGMPPIEVFVGLDAIRSSAEEVPGLPTRPELQALLDEHDRIEKETEIFDSGELKKLRKLTKAATKRHLSPEDTDLIELTLTTIYELDKLLHLLRDRSEHLELLGTRMTWEEQRIGAWIDRRQILADLDSFLATRARWSPSVYESNAPPPPQEITLTRRGSIASMASMASGDSSLSASMSSAAFSRSARFKQAELLSRDAAQFAGRISTLRHSKITAAGKALDKLIDNSRKPVPEELLDEQDRVEEKGINDMETVGKFAMNVIMQWRKADEIYVETLKDQAAAQSLLEEIETAMFHHPTARQSNAFVTRADALAKRLILRGNPTASSSTFPCPVHPLFPDQRSSNESLASTLSFEITSALDLVKKVEASAKEYRAAFEAVKDVDTLSQTSKELSAIFSSVHDRLTNGVLAGEGDGSPPDLTSKACLDATRHSAFLTLLPDILKESDAASQRTSPLLRTYRAAILKLDHPGIDPAFKSNAITEINQLGQQKDQTDKIKADVIARAGRLRDARKIWTIMDQTLKTLDDTRRDIGDAMERRRWKQQAPSTGAPLTPESPISVLLTDPVLPVDVLRKLETAQDTLSQEVDGPLSSLSVSLEPPLKDWLSQSYMGLLAFLDSLKQMSRLLEAIQNQASVMATVRNEVEDFQMRIENLKLRIEGSSEDILAGTLFGNQLTDTQATLRTDTKIMQDMAQMFMDGLSQRVPFVAQPDLPSRSRPNFVKRRFASVDLKLGASPHTAAIELPFELASLDDAVRTDSNAYVMRLAGELQNLDLKANHFQLATMAKEVDLALASTLEDLQGLVRHITAFRTSLSTATGAITEDGDITESLQSLLQEVDEFSNGYRSRFARSFSPIRELLRRMDVTPGCHDPAVRDTLYVARTQAVNDAEIKLNVCHDDVASLKAHIMEAQRAESQRVENRRLKQERLEKERLERERLKNERVEAERLEKERLEKERLEAEQLEMERLENERLENERLEKERVESERLEKERVEKERLEQERLETERLETERHERELLEQRRLEEERLAKERMAKELMEKEEKRLEQESLERVRLESERLDKERLKQQWLENERIEKEQEQRERQRLEKEEHQRKQEREKAEKSKQEKQAAQMKLQKSGQAASANDPDDVFRQDVRSHQTIEELRTLILELRRRLRAISISDVARPQSSASYDLPDQQRTQQMDSLLSSVTTEVAHLPKCLEDPTVDAELRSLRAEVDAYAKQMQRVRDLADLSGSVQLCDSALSDLLEHVDSYPSPPMGSLVSSHTSQLRLPPEEQLKARVLFTRDTIRDMRSKFLRVEDDFRAVAEKERIDQTWGELEDMANDLATNKKSRPSSVISSGRSSRASIGSSHSAVQKPGSEKKGSYANLSVRPSARTPSNRGKYLSPAQSLPRRALSGSSDTPSRSTSRLSTVSSSARSVSGPMTPSSSNPSTSTFASRQRTTSLSSNASSFATPVKRAVGTPARPRAQTGQTKRTASPTFSDASSLSQSHTRSFSGSNSRSTGGPARSTSSMSTWSRAPRQSFPLPTLFTPPRKPPPRKEYVANPKNKLDVAVGDVVNKLPVNIKVEMVPETWKDQSGKYWIGDQDPKLCFCRILRSRAVMVRVGGGWCALESFIKTHFADQFRFMPVESPPRPTVGQEEKWISSSTLLPPADITVSPPKAPRTPEPKGPFLPSFSLMTPSGQSPRSLKSTSSTGSPLTPLQFMRRVEQYSPGGLRPASPSRAPTGRPRHSAPNTPSRNPLWRP